VLSVTKFIILFVTLFSVFLLRASEGYIEYKNIIEATSMDLFLEQDLSQFNKLAFKIRLTPEDTSLKKNELQLTLKGAGWEQTFLADHNGNIGMEISKKLYVQNPKAYLNKTGKGRVHIGLDILIKNDKSSLLRSKEVTDAIAQYNQAISEAGFMVKLMAPKLNKVRLRLVDEGVCTISYSEIHPQKLVSEKDHYIDIDSFEIITEVGCSKGFYAVYLET